MPKTQRMPDVFHAIADPNRRTLLDLLAHEARPVGDCVDALGITYAAVSQHLTVLHNVGLVERRAEGRQRLYRAQFKPLQAVHDWTATYQNYWQDKLKNLGDYLDTLDDEDQV